MWLLLHPKPWASSLKDPIWLVFPPSPADWLMIDEHKKARDTKALANGTTGGQDKKQTQNAVLTPLWVKQKGSRGRSEKCFLLGYLSSNR